MWRHCGHFSDNKVGSAHRTGKFAKPCSCSIFIDISLEKSLCRLSGQDVFIRTRWTWLGTSHLQLGEGRSKTQDHTQAIRCNGDVSISAFDSGTQESRPQGPQAAQPHGESYGVRREGAHFIWINNCSSRKPPKDESERNRNRNVHFNVTSDAEEVGLAIISEEQLNHALDAPAALSVTFWKIMMWENRTILVRFMKNADNQCNYGLGRGRIKQGKEIVMTTEWTVHSVDLGLCNSLLYLWGWAVHLSRTWHNLYICPLNAMVIFLSRCDNPKMSPDLTKHLGAKIISLVERRRIKAETLVISNMLITGINAGLWRGATN